MEDKLYWVYDENYEWLPAKVMAISDSICTFEVKVENKKFERQVNIKETPLQEVHPSCLSKNLFFLLFS